MDSPQELKDEQAAEAKTGSPDKLHVSNQLTETEKENVFQACGDVQLNQSPQQVNYASGDETGRHSEKGKNNIHSKTTGVFQCSTSTREFKKCDRTSFHEPNKSNDDNPTECNGERVGPYTRANDGEDAHTFLENRIEIVKSSSKFVECTTAGNFEKPERDLQWIMEGSAFNDTEPTSTHDATMSKHNTLITTHHASTYTDNDAASTNGASFYKDINPISIHTTSSDAQTSGDLHVTEITDISASKDINLTSINNPFLIRDMYPTISNDASNSKYNNYVGIQDIPISNDNSEIPGQNVKISNENNTMPAHDVATSNDSTKKLDHDDDVAVSDESHKFLFHDAAISNAGNKTPGHDIVISNDSNIMLINDLRLFKDYQDYRTVHASTSSHINPTPSEDVTKNDANTPKKLHDSKSFEGGDIKECNSTAFKEPLLKTPKKKISFTRKVWSKLKRLNPLRKKDNKADDDDSELLPGTIYAGPDDKRKIVKFDVKAFFEDQDHIKEIGQRHDLTFRISGDAHIMKDILKAHGFREMSIKSRYNNFSWIGNSICALAIDQLHNYQIINHFVRSFQLTRKDMLYRNVTNLGEKKGRKIDFLPTTFILPSDMKKFKQHCQKRPGTYIVKPIGLSRGRGVYLVNSHKGLRKELTDTIVSRYISNPLLIDGYKTDLRIYVLVTSFNPLVFYIYREGLTRFATVKYKRTQENNLGTLRMHLTNFSINAISGNYIKNEDSAIEDFGSKWTLSALLRYFQSDGINTMALMQNIEDLVVKTIVSVEKCIAHGCRMYQRDPKNCFELFGFDIMLDDKYKPWLLEVNLSPSLVCGSPLDIKVKANMLCDLLNLIGIECYEGHKPRDWSKLSSTFNVYLHRTVGYYCFCRLRDQIFNFSSRRKNKKKYKLIMKSYRDQEKKAKREYLAKKREDIFVETEAKMEDTLKRFKNENLRSGGWVRIFPVVDSWSKYRDFMQYPTPQNAVLHRHFYPHKHNEQTKTERKELRKDFSKQEKAILENTKQNYKEGISEDAAELLERMVRYHSSLTIGPPPFFSVKKSVRSATLEQSKEEGNNTLSEDIKTKVLNSVSRGFALSELQARTIFLKYLTNLKQILHECDVHNDVPISPPKMILTDLLFRFLGQASDPVTDPNGTPNECTLNSCLTSFLYHYHQETRKLHLADKSCQLQAKVRGTQTKYKKMVPPELFDDFIHSASPWDLEELLLTYVNEHGDTRIFLKRRIDNEIKCCSQRKHDNSKTTGLTHDTEPASGDG